jgi:replication initiation protein RepC
MPPRNADGVSLEQIADELRILWRDVDKHLKVQVNSEDMSGNDAHNERHYQNSNTDPLLDSEQSLPRRLEETPAPESKPMRAPVRAFSLALVLQACPDITMYTKGGSGIATWRDLINAAGVVRPMLGVSPSAWAEACGVMGDEQASIVLAAILQRDAMIRSAGAYLRNLTEKAREGQFSVGPMILALLRTTAGQERRSA